MILSVDVARAGGMREGYLALRREGESWVAIDAVVFETADAAVRRCVEDLCALLDGLVGLALEGVLGSLELVQGLEVVNEGLWRLWQEPGEADRVEIPACVMATHPAERE